MIPTGDSISKCERTQPLGSSSSVRVNPLILFTFPKITLKIHQHSLIEGCHPSSFSFRFCDSLFFPCLFRCDRRHRSYDEIQFLDLRGTLVSNETGTLINRGDSARGLRSGKGTIVCFVKNSLSIYGKVVYLSV